MPHNHSKLPDGVGIGPDGQFVSIDDHDMFDDVEVVTFSVEMGVEASNLNGVTSFSGEANTVEGTVLVDYDDVVDRNESLFLLDAHHRLSTWINSTETADGTVRTYVEVSASPVFELGEMRFLSTDVLEGDQRGDIVGEAGSDDSIDLIGRPMAATAHAPFSDGSSGAGGGGSAGEDDYVSSIFPAESGRFHPRDELFLNASFESTNVDDAGIHLDLSGQHIYGVIED